MREVKDLTWCLSAVASGTLWEPLSIGLLKSACLEGADPGNDVDSLAQWSFGFHHGLDPLLSHGEH